MFEKKFLMPLICLVVVLSLSATATMGANILFVSSMTAVEDDALKAFMEGLGHTVTYLDDDEDEATTEAAAIAADLVFISESVGSGGIKNEITEIETPMIVGEPWAWDEMGLTDGDGGDANAVTTDVEIVDPGHYMAAGLSGTVAVLTDILDGCNLGKGIVGPEATVIATATLYDGVTYDVIFVYEKGAALPVAPADGSAQVAADIRIGFGFHEITYPVLSDNAYALLGAAIDYALGLTGPPEPVDMEIGFAAQPPVIDGEVDETWADASTQYFVPLDDPANASGSWMALYDSVNLYVIVDVTDDSLQNDSDGSWQDDSVELYFDGGNTKVNTPLSGDDHQYTFAWTTDEIQGTNVDGATEGIEHAQVDTDTGWRIEIKLPWLSLQGAAPQAGDLIGIDCYYNDDDDGGDSRENKLLTFSAQEYWNDASGWGTALLTAIPVTDPDLLIYYNFESGAGEMAIDRSGHNNHGLFMGNPEWATGIFGGCVAIDIADLDYIQTEAPLNIVSNTVTVTGWVKHDESPAGWSGILTHRGTEPGCLGLQHDGTELRYMWGADVYWSFSSGLQMPNGEWYFAALAISPDQGKLYLNGIEQTATNVAPHEPTNFDSLIRVGRDHNDDRIMTSLIDEVRFYNRTLTDVDIQRLLLSDVTAPGDNVVGVPNDGLMDGNNFGWPPNEIPDLAVDDDTATKFLHFKGELEPTGFQVTPLAGPSIVTGLTLTTANDEPPRDPVTFELSGSNEGIDGPYELIASGDIVDFALADAWPRFTMNSTPISFDNDVAYAHYQVLFPALRDAGSANSMQIAEVELLGVPAPAGPVGYWMLDDGEGTIAVDSSGNGNDGTLIGDPQWATGIIGGALDFDGDGDYVDCGNDASLDITGPISIALWIRPDADDPEGQATTTAPMAKAMAGMSPSWSYQVRYGWGSPQPYMAFTFNSSPRAWAYVGRNLERYEWCHIACSHDGTTLKCYLNGEETDSTPMGQFTSSPSPVLIGSDGWACDWIGAIDEVAIYDRALSADEILELAGVSGGNLLPNPSFEEDEPILDDPDWVSWCTWNPAEGAGSNTTIVDTESIDGTRSLLVEPIGAENWFFILVNISFPANLDKNYTTGFWAKAEAPRPLTLQMKASDNSVDAWGATDFDLTTEWAEYSYTSEVLHQDVKLEFLCAGSEVPFWLDLVTVYEAE